MGFKRLCIQEASAVRSSNRTNVYTINTVIIRIIHYTVCKRNDVLTGALNISIDTRMEKSNDKNICQSLNDKPGMTNAFLTTDKQSGRFFVKL